MKNLKDSEKEFINEVRALRSIKEPNINKNLDLLMSMGYDIVIRLGSGGYNIMLLVECGDIVYRHKYKNNRGKKPSPELFYKTDFLTHRDEAMNDLVHYAIGNKEIEEVGGDIIEQYEKMRSLKKIMNEMRM